jgi:tetratricopeptide (TPR) repeat protein
MKPKPPPDRRKFTDDWDEIRYLYDKLLYWLYQRADREKARPYAERLEPLLPKADPDHQAVFGEECHSLVCEAKGNMPDAIKHRENEISLIHRLYQIASGTPCQDDLLNDYGYDALSDRLDLLATLYHDNGQLDKAIETLQESKDLCQEHAIPFDGEDLLRVYQAESKPAIPVHR